MYYYIVNPASGHAKVRGLQDKVRRRLDELGIRGEWAKTTGPGDATRMAQAAIEKGATTIVAVGGDNTVNEVINGIHKSSVAVGIIPMGAKNHLASQLGIETWQQACEVLAARRLTPYGLIAAGQKYFLSTLTLGFETDLDKTLDAPPSDQDGSLWQILKVFGRARAYNPLEAKITVDDQYSLKCNLFSLSVSNQKFLNQLADNKLVVNLSDHPGKPFRLGSYVWQLLRRREQSPLEEAATTRFTANRLVIETNPITGLMIDGKVSGRTPIAIRLTDRRIRFITEKAASAFRP